MTFLDDSSISQLRPLSIFENMIMTPVFSVLGLPKRGQPGAETTQPIDCMLPQADAYPS